MRQQRYGSLLWRQVRYRPGPAIDRSPDATVCLIDLGHLGRHPTKSRAPTMPIACHDVMPMVPGFRRDDSALRAEVIVMGQCYEWLPDAQRESRCLH